MGTETALYRDNALATTAKTSEWERAGHKPGGGGPPATFCVRAFLEKAWLPARDRAGNHVAGSNLRWSRRDHLPLDNPAVLLYYVIRTTTQGGKPMGKARTPGAPGTCAAGAAHCRGAAVRGGGVLRPGPAGRPAGGGPAGGPGGPPGLPLALGQDLVRHALFRYQTRASLPRAYFARRRRPWGRGMSTWSWPSPRARRGRSSACSPTGTTTTSPWPWTRTWRPWSATTAGGIAFPGLEPGDRPRPGPPGGGLLLVSPPAATRHQKQIILRRLGKINQEGSAWQTCWASSSRGLAAQPDVLLPVRLPDAAAGGAPLLPQRPLPGAPHGLCGPGCPGGPDPGGGLHPGGGRLLAWEARPLPAGWQASA